MSIVVSNMNFSAEKWFDKMYNNKLINFLGSLQQTSCVKDLDDEKLRCLCGDNKAPINGLCTATLRGNELIFVEQKKILLHVIAYVYYYILYIYMNV